VECPQGETPMPFTWSISINSNTSPPPEAQFNPDPLLQVEPGDQIFWANNDNAAHWPGLLNSDGSINATFFMPNKIAAHSTSEPFSPSVGGTLKYVCSLHPDEQGTIQVS
jgi:plastocyanin